MKNEKTLTKLIEGQIRLEKDIAAKLQALEQRVDSVAARLLIREIQLDTKKHAEILSESLKTIGAPKSFWDFTIYVDADKRSVKKALEEHVKAEEEMTRLIENETKKTEDEVLKILLEHFLEDEKRHHKYLKNILARTYEKEF